MTPDDGYIINSASEFRDRFSGEFSSNFMDEEEERQEYSEFPPFTDDLHAEGCDYDS